MNKNVITCLLIANLLSGFASTLLYKDGSSLHNRNVTFKNDQVISGQDKIIDTSKIRAIIINNEQKQIINPKYTDKINTLIRNTKVMSNRENRILSKKQTFTLDQNQYWTEACEILQFLNSVELNKFELNIKFNSNHEMINIESLLYSDADGNIKPFPSNSVKIFSSSKDYPQLKVMSITLRHLTNDSIVLIKTKKIQFDPSPIVRLSLNPIISDDVLVEKSEITLKISQKYKDLEVKTELSDPETPLNYNIIKVGDYISRQWHALNLPPNNGKKAVTLKLTTNKLPKTKQINLFSQQLRAKVKSASETAYCKQLFTIKNIDDLFDQIKKDFRIIKSQSNLNQQSVEQVVQMKTATVNETMPLIIATLEHKKLKPELYLINRIDGSTDSLGMVIKVENKFYFLHPEAGAKNEQFATCYYGYNLGAEIKIPQSLIRDKPLSISLTVNQVTPQSSGNLQFDIARHLEAKELDLLRKSFPGVDIKLRKHTTTVTLHNRTQLIMDQLISFRIPNIMQFLVEKGKKEKVTIEVLLPKGWRVQSLPNDKIGETTYTPSMNGFTVRTQVLDKHTDYQTPIIMKHDILNKRWFD
ncbi:MAG: hypothetical protein KAG98_01315 [Lentisphaeria bacterium]|nr:hypothetical protein [Lentisphaeria bacterium]